LDFSLNEWIGFGIGGTLALTFGGTASFYNWATDVNLTSYRHSTAPTLFIFFFICLGLCLPFCIWKQQQGFAGATLVGLTMISGFSFAAQAGYQGNLDHLATISKGAHLQANQALIVGAFGVFALVSFALLVLASKYCYKEGGNAGKLFWMTGTVLTIATTCTAGGIVWTETIHNATNTTWCPVLIGAALFLGVFVFLCVGSRSANKPGVADDAVVEGFFKDNKARVAFSLFFSVSTSTLAGTLWCCGKAGIVFGLFGVFLGIFLCLFPLIYLKFSKKVGEPLATSGPMKTLISITSFSLGATAFGVTWQTPWIWIVGVSAASVFTVIIIGWLICNGDSRAACKASCYTG